MIIKIILTVEFLGVGHFDLSLSKNPLTRNRDKLFSDGSKKLKNRNLSIPNSNTFCFFKTGKNIFRWYISQRNLYT